ncbi:MAG: chalcone isomerase family protein [Burkholderiaceae bacterium]
MRKWLLGMLIGVSALGQLVFAPSAPAAEVEGVAVEDRVEVGGVPLLLNGAGMRAIYIVKAYVAALYVQRRSADAQTLLAQPGPWRLSLTMLADLSGEWLAQRVQDGVRESSDADTWKRLRPRVAQLVETIEAVGRTRRGERVDVDCVDGAVTVSIDGQRVGPPIPSEELFRALLRMFVGERPVDAELKRSLLGQ